ncbi:unnamed protein product [Trichogramma brassicae]|uniref:C2H2-type domain-containing protein n=1 Tax=Trichogramma brassicae TaxID=86971 RepID=A0A6H5J2W7_9HYME|nr:unnamed protein product [Trichogramma brassicae]
MSRGPILPLAAAVSIATSCSVGLTRVTTTTTTRSRRTATTTTMTMQRSHAKRQSDLKKHICAIHDRSKPFQCEICHKSFSLKKYCKRHISALHDRRNPFECETCHKSFGDKKRNLDNSVCIRGSTRFIIIYTEFASRRSPARCRCRRGRCVTYTYVSFAFQQFLDVKLAPLGNNRWRRARGVECRPVAITASSITRSCPAAASLLSSSYRRSRLPSTSPPRARYPAAAAQHSSGSHPPFPLAVFYMCSENGHPGRVQICRPLTRVIPRVPPTPTPTPRREKYSITRRIRCESSQLVYTYKARTGRRRCRRAPTLGCEPSEMSRSSIRRIESATILGVKISTLIRDITFASQACLGQSFGEISCAELYHRGVYLIFFLFRTGENKPQASNNRTGERSRRARVVVPVVDIHNRRGLAHDNPRSLQLINDKNPHKSIMSATDKRKHMGQYNTFLNFRPHLALFVEKPSKQNLKLRKCIVQKQLYLSESWEFLKAGTGVGKALWLS